jgi:hypothetical protein
LIDDCIFCCGPRCCCMQTMASLENNNEGRRTTNELTRTERQNQTRQRNGYCEPDDQSQTTPNGCNHFSRAEMNPGDEGHMPPFARVASKLWQPMHVLRLGCMFVVVVVVVDASVAAVAWCCCCRLQSDTCCSSSSFTVACVVSKLFQTGVVIITINMRLQTEPNAVTTACYDND